MGSERVPVAELLVELLHILLSLPFLVLALPPFFQDRSIVVCSTSVIVDTVLLRRIRGWDGILCTCRHDGHEGLLDSRSGFLGLRALDVVWVVKVGSCTFT
jgi:hypothetical protein